MVGDVNSDLLPDVVIVKNLHGDLLWFENSGNPADGLWQRHVITKGKLAGAYDVALSDLDADGDLDGDGHTEVVATGWGEPGQVAWFRHGGDPRGEWSRHLLKDNWRRATQVLVADLGGDRDLDIAAIAERGTLEFRWWRNESSGGSPD